MGWFNIGGVGQAIWGKVTQVFSPPPPPAPPSAPAITLARDSMQVDSGGLSRLRDASLVDTRQQPLVDQRQQPLVSNATGRFSRPWWHFW